MRYVILAFLLVGCGGGSGLRRGSPVPVRPPQAQRGPLVGPLPPGQQRGARPSAKDLKPLPMTDTVRASGKHYPYEVGPFFVDFDGAPKTLREECEKRMTAALLRAAPTLDRRDLDTDEALCLDAKLYALCANREMKGRTDDAAKKARRQADEHGLYGCSRHSLSPRVLGLYEAVLKVLSEG